MCRRLWQSAQALAQRDSFTRDANEVISRLSCLLVDLHAQPIDREPTLDGGGPHVLLKSVVSSVFSSSFVFFFFFSKESKSFSS